MKRKLTLLGLVGILIVVFVYSITTKPIEAPIEEAQTEIVVSGESFFVDIARSDAERARGLSGRSGLTQNEGLLFVFEYPDTYGFWMKDMLFAIDILWIDAEGAIVHIEKNVFPETYPKIFKPDMSATYVLEVNAGEVERLGLRQNDIVELGDL